MPRRTGVQVRWLPELPNYTQTYTFIINVVIVFIIFHPPVTADLDSFPPPCSDVPPTNLLETAIPRPRSLPRGVNIIYDRASHVHSFQFLAEADDILLNAETVFRRCQYFPYEFSLFFTLKQFTVPRREQCLFSLYHRTTSEKLMSVGLVKDRVILRFKGQRYRVRVTRGYQDRKWHNIGVSVAANTVQVTKDCKGRRLRHLRMPFPDLLPVANTTFSMGRCQKKASVYQGLLKSVILVPGGDASVRACPPKMDIESGLDNVIHTFPGHSSLTPFQSRASVCEWSDVGNIAFDVHVHKLKVCVNGVWKEVKVSTDKRRLDYLVPYQTLDTGKVSLDVEVFDIPGEGKFAAFATAGYGQNIPSRSGVYQWSKGQFSLYQTLPTESAQAWEYFAIKDQFFLAVANYGLTPSSGTNSTVFRWSKSRKKFRKYQQLMTFTARDVEAFTIDGDTYLAVANHAKGDDSSIDSVIYKWARRERRFQEFQRLRTIGAYDWTYFELDGYHFLCVANAFTGLTTLVYSVLYVWNEGRFVEFQTIETNGATDWEHFSIDGDHFLAVANAYNYGSQNFQDVDNYRTNSTIYKLDRERRVFTKFQTLVTNSAIDWEYFSIGSDHYLIVSNAQNGGTDDRLLSVLYRWQGLDRFVPVHNLYTLPNADFEIFRDNSEIYLVYANAKDSKSQVLKVKFV